MSGKTKAMLIRFGISMAMLVVFTLHTGGIVPMRLLTALENITYDARIRATMPSTIDPRVVIADLDDKSLAAEGQWPWPRDKLARMIEQLFGTYHVRSVGFDIVFAEVDRASGSELLRRLAAGPLADLSGLKERIPALSEQLDNDKAFAAAIKGHPVVLGYAFKSEGAQGLDKASTGALCAPLVDKTEAAQYVAVEFLRWEGYVGNLNVLQEATPYCGFIDLPTIDYDGVIRTVPLLQMHDGKVYPSLALATVRAAMGDPPVQLEFEPPDAKTGINLERLRVGPIVAPVNDEKTVAVRAPYRGPERSFPYVSVSDVMHGTVDPKVLEGAIVFVGTTAPGLKDLRTTPVEQAYPGVEVHANIASALLDSSIKQQAPYYLGMEFTTLLVIGLLLAWLFPKVAPLWSAGVAFGVILAGVSFGMWMWNRWNFVMPMGVPIVYTLVVFLAQLLYGYFIEARRARDTARTFGQYVPKEIVEEMAASNLQISMEGKSKEMTVLFSDVRGFTTISEQFKDKPTELSELMNQFLTPLTEIIQKHRGTIDKYMGDAIMAFWGAPLDDAEHAKHALEAAMELPKAIRQLDDTFAKRGWPPLKIGVGLSTGNMRVGNMGSSFRVAYTVMGDPVNLGSRVEALTKEYGVAVICSEFTRNAGPGEWSYRELDTIRVKGKDVPVTIYEPMGPKDSLDPAVRQDLARHRGALKLFRSQQWDQAEAEFFSLSRGANKHAVYELFLERIAHYRKNPPGPKWDGVWTFTHK